MSPAPWRETSHLAAAVIVTRAHCCLTAAGHCNVILGTIKFVDKSVNDNSARRLDHCDVIDSRSGFGVPTGVPHSKVELQTKLKKKSNTRMLVTFGICFKQHFDTRYLVFYNTSPPRMFSSLGLLWEYRIQHGANGPLYVTSNYSTWIFCRGVSGFATDCPCGAWCRGLTTCLLHVGPPFRNLILNNSWAVGLT